MAQAVRRGIDRGELPDDASSDLIVEALIGPLYLRALVTGEVLDAALVTGTVGLLLAGAREWRAAGPAPAASTRS